MNSLETIVRKSSTSVGSSPFEETHEKKEAEKIVTLSTLWWQVDMKMSVRLRHRLQKGKEMAKKEKDSGHLESKTSWPLNSLNFDPKM